MQIRVIKHIRKVYGCRGCETAPVTADKPAQLIEKSMASPSVLAMLLTTKYVDGLPLHRFETVLSRHGVEIPRQTLARWVIQCSEHFQPLLNLMRDRLFESPFIHCDETRVQVLGFVRKVLPHTAQAAGQSDHGRKASRQLVVTSAYSAVLF
ncbi:ISPpu15, transposase [Pseudomonas syringae pv. solidagae]|uniref:ISPpu15, transposase n=1 Tax=Pseudomonas syringae pv. solidagae TaxID=264458 RepID=A0A0Q0ABW3_PSESX|nr:ISPpu15, transposase [Pseudomonas syringae pv. solidagae]RMT38966.1 ISPpu15, transposase [Pseudomonas syringae pv. solidagae]RMT44724.1 ISPpu15, transposase [Pseudomonas syringae pv. solidagae]